MDRAYEGNETRQLALDLGFIPVVPPMKTRIEPWEYDREMYKRRNEVERLFRRLKGYRRIFSRFEKLDALFIGSSTSCSSPMGCVVLTRPSRLRRQGPRFLRLSARADRGSRTAPPGRI